MLKTFVFVFHKCFRYNKKERVSLLESFYQNMLAFIRKYPCVKKTIIFLTKFCPYITFALYPCIIINLWLNGSPFFLEALIRPCIAFGIVTVFRKIVNRPRPYDHMNIEPLYGHKHGESFPSRHSVSAWIIAFVCFYVNAYIGIAACFVAALISLCRILCGVHHISDVLAAFIIALICYII